VVLSLIGCDAVNPAVIDDSPPINASLYGINVNEGGIQVMPYYYQIADGKVAGHIPWSKIGYNGALVAATEADVWSFTGSYVYPVGQAGMEVLSSDNTQDIGTVIFSGTSSGGSTTSLIDATKNFNGGTAVAVGDCIVLDKSGAVPEFGYVSAVTSNTELAVSGGFSVGGTGSVRAYSIIDRSAYTGAQAVRIQYLDGAYVEKFEIVILNGTTIVPTVNLDLFRINSFVVVATGTGLKSVGNITIRNLADTPTYSYISAGYTRARNIIYTVPAGKTLFVTSATFGYAYAQNSTHYCRLYTRANVDPITGFQTDGEMFAFTEVVCSNNTIVREFEIPANRQIMSILYPLPCCLGY